MRLFGKKGGVDSLFLLMMMLFVMGIFMFIGMYLKDQLFPVFEDVFVGTKGVTITQTIDNAFNALDMIFLFTTIFMGLASVLLATQVKAHPAFFFINLLMLVILLAIAPAISNAMRDIMLTDQLNTYTTSLPITVAVFQYLPLILGAFGFLLSIATFKGGSSET